MIRRLAQLWMRVLGTVRNESFDSDFQSEIEEPQVQPRFGCE